MACLGFVFCPVGYKLWGRRCERDCPIEYSASLEAVEVSKGNISVGTTPPGPTYSFPSFCHAYLFIFSLKDY